MKKTFIISGPPGVGKSTVSMELAKKLKKSVYIDGDMLYHQVIGGYSSPWEENNHLTIIYEVLVNITNIYLRYGYDVIIDYYLDYESYLSIQKKICVNDINFYALSADTKTIVNRDSHRKNNKIMGNRVIDAIKEISESNIPEKYVIDTTYMSVDDVVLLITKNSKNY